MGAFEEAVAAEMTARSGRDRWPPWEQIGSGDAPSGAVKRGQKLSQALIAMPLSCGNPVELHDPASACPVVVLDVVGSNPIAHPKDAAVGSSFSYSDSSSGCAQAATPGSEAGAA
jgi:hypothetical protein